MAKDLNLKTDKLFLITVITSWSLEFKVTNPNTDIISSFDSYSLVNSGKGCYVWIKLDEMKTDILFEPVWQGKWKLQNQAVKLTFKAQALWLEGVCVVFLAILCFIGKPLQQLAVHNSFLHAICSQVKCLRSTLRNLRQYFQIFEVYKVLAWFNICFLINCNTVKSQVWVLTLQMWIFKHYAGSHSALRVDNSCWEDKCFAQGRGMHWVTVRATYMKASPLTSDSQTPFHSTTCGNTASKQKSSYSVRSGEWGKEKQDMQPKRMYYLSYW